MSALFAWLWTAVAPNLVASGIAFAAAWTWKIRPHVRAQREHREDVAAWIVGLHDRLDDIEHAPRHRHPAEYPDQRGELEVQR